MIQPPLTTTLLNAVLAFGDKATTAVSAVTTNSTNSTNSTNVTSTATPAYGGDLYLGSLLACYLCIFLCRLLLTV